MSKIPQIHPCTQQPPHGSLLQYPAILVFSIEMDFSSMILLMNTVHCMESICKWTVTCYLRSQFSCDSFTFAQCCSIFSKSPSNTLSTSTNFSYVLEHKQMKSIIFHLFISWHDSFIISCVSVITFVWFRVCCLRQNVALLACLSLRSSCSIF